MSRAQRSTYKIGRLIEKSVHESGKLDKYSQGELGQGGPQCTGLVMLWLADAADPRLGQDLRRRRAIP